MEGKIYGANALGLTSKRGYDAWERWQPQLGDVFGIGNHVVANADLEQGMTHAIADEYGPFDMLYTDPPWGAGVARAFRTKAGVDGEKGNKVDWDRFEGLMIDLFSTAAPLAFIEIGRGQTESLIEGLEEVGGVLHGRWELVAKESPLGHWLLCFTFDGMSAPDLRDYQGHDSNFTPGECIEDAEPSMPDNATVFEPFAGLGWTAKFTAQRGHTFIGCELAPRRAAETMDVLFQITGEEPKIIGSLL